MCSTVFIRKDINKKMKIKIASGVGTGPTTLAAFDAALNHAGVANYNIIKLSSVIPPKTTIEVKNTGKLTKLPGGWGRSPVCSNGRGAGRYAKRRSVGWYWLGTR
jgi:pyruvoyl-dependent arginine decarboxylase